MTWRNPFRQTPLTPVEEIAVDDALEEGKEVVREVTVKHFANLDRLGYLRKEVELAQLRQERA